VFGLLPLGPAYYYCYIVWLSPIPAQVKILLAAFLERGVGQLVIALFLSEFRDFMCNFLSLLEPRKALELGHPDLQVLQNFVFENVVKETIAAEDEEVVFLQLDLIELGLLGHVVAYLMVYDLLL